MTNYTNTMREALKSMYISEDNIAMLRDIVKRKSAKSIKFADGTMKVDLFTASAVIQALDKVNPATKAKITKLINTGKKANFMGVAKVVMKSENDPEIKEEVSLETEEVSLLAQQAAILISKRERERNPRKEQVQLDEGTWAMPDSSKKLKGLMQVLKRPIPLGKGGDSAVSVIRDFIGDDELYDDLGDAGDKNPKGDARPIIMKAMKRLKITQKNAEVEIDEEMNPTDHVKKKGDKYCVYNADGSIAKEFDNEKDANRYAIDNHDSLMGEEADLDEAVGKDWQKAVHALSKKMGASVASGAKGKIIPFVSMNGDTTDVGYTDSKGKKHTIYTTKKSLPRAEKDKMIADIRKKFSEEFSEEVELDEEKTPSHAELVKGKYGDEHAGAQHFSRIGGKEYTWNYLERKGGKYVVTTKKTGEIGLSRAGSKDFKTAKIVKEETELDEGQLKDMLAQAGDIEYYAKRHGGIDKKDMMKAASLLKKGNKSGALNFVSKLDTSPREKILDLMGEEVELDEIVPVHEILPALFFGGLGAAMLGFMLVSMKMIIQGTSLEASIKKIVDKLKKNKNYKMSDSEKSDVKGFVSKVKKDKPNILQKAMKKFKEEVEESYEFGTDEYTKHTKDVTPGQGKDIDEARPSARRDAMRDMGKRGKDSADDDYVATADDRKAADKNIIMQLRKATNLGGKYEVTFKDKKKVKVKPEIAMAFLKKFEKMKPADKAKLQDKGSKSYKDLLKGLKEEDTSMLGRIERKLKEIRNG